MGNLNEILGIVAGVAIAVSLLMRDLTKLRIINMIGSALFAIYGFFLPSLPVLLLNSFVVITNAVYLYRNANKKPDCSVINIAGPDDQLLQVFLKNYADDIAKAFPEFKREFTADAQAIFVLHNMQPSALIVYKMVDRDYQLLIDYTIPSARNKANAEHFFASFVAHLAIVQDCTIFASTHFLPQQQYWQNLGFSEEPASSAENSGAKRFAKKIVRT